MPYVTLDLIRYYIVGLWHRRWSILAVAWIVSPAAGVLVSLVPNTYTASAQIDVDTQSIIGPLMKNLTVMPDLDRQVQMIRQTLLSRPNLEELVRQVGLGRSVSGPLAYEDLLTQLAREIEIHPRSASLLEISYRARDPALAYRLVSSVVDLFVTRNLGHAQRDIAAASVFINQQISDYEVKLREADLTLADFKRKHAEELDGAGRSQRELEDARSEKRILESERASTVWQRGQLALQLASTPRRVGQGETSQGPTRAEARLAQLQTELDQALLLYTERHPAVLGLRRLVGQAEEDVARGRAGGGNEATVVNSMVAQLQEQLRGLDLRIADLDRRATLVSDSINRLSVRVAETPQVEADLLRLTRDYDILSKSYQELVQRREAAHLAKQMDSETSGVAFRVVDPPVVPRLPSGPPRALLMLAVAAFGVGTGLGIASLRILLRKEVVNVEQLAQAFGFRILGAVGELRMPGSRLVRTAEIALIGLLVLFYVGCYGRLAYLYHSNPATTAPAELASVGAAWSQHQLRTTATFTSDSAEWSGRQLRTAAAFASDSAEWLGHQLRSIAAFASDRTERPEDQLPRLAASDSDPPRLVTPSGRE
jgi:polysaccharide chain length determinant protein (PEP-CTERM system associated)